MSAPISKRERLAIDRQDMPARDATARSHSWRPMATNASGVKG